MTEHHTTPRHGNLRIRARQDARSLHARANKPLSCVRATRFFFTIALALALTLTLALALALALEPLTT